MDGKLLYVHNTAVRWKKYLHKLLNIRIWEPLVLEPSFNEVHCWEFETLDV
jgi:hypothetical protein